MPIKDLEKRRANHRRYMKERYHNDPAHRAKHMARVVSRMHGRVIKKPCEVCGSTNAEKHHEDYSRPHDVNWLCRDHHLDLHTE